MPVQQQPMAPMPFYADPNRFPTPVWQADPSQGWPQGQFIQQLPATGQPIDTYQQYPNGIYQTTYQQPAFETNTFYTGAVQVLTNPRPPSTPNQQAQLAPPRPNSNYSHTPSPSPAQQQQQQSGANRQYQEYSIPQQQQQGNQQNFIPPPTTPTGNENSQTGSNSRPGSVNNINPPTPNQNFNQQQQQAQQQQQPPQQQQGSTTFTSMGNFSPNSSSNYVNTSSGNGQPGYPPVNNSSPQLDSHNSSGYPGQEQYGGQSHQWQNEGQMMWEQQQVKMEPAYDHPSEQSNQYMQEVNRSPNKMEPMHNEQKTFSQADKVNLNTRIKTMILNKQQENKQEDTKPVEQNNTGHFLWYSHHHHLTKGSSVDGGPQNLSHDDSLTPNQKYYDKKPDPRNGFREYKLKNGYQAFEKDMYRPSIDQSNTVQNLSQTTGQLSNSKHIQQKLYYSPNTPNPLKDQILKDFKSEVPDIMPGFHKKSMVSSHNQFKIPQDMLMSNYYIPEEEMKHFQPPVDLKNRHLPQNLPYLNGIKKYSFDDDLKSRTSTPDNSQNYHPQFKTPSGSPISNNYIPEQRMRECKTPGLNGIKKYYFEDNNARSRTSTPDELKYHHPEFKTPCGSPMSHFEIKECKTPADDSRQENLNRLNEIKNYPTGEQFRNLQLNTPIKGLKEHHTNQYSPSSTSTNASPLKNQQTSPITRTRDAFSEKINKQVGTEIPSCRCFPPDQAPPEPGTYYTHLGCANSLQSLRYDLECRTGVRGNAIRIEKVRYTGKEGKTAQGCPIAKWVIRRQSADEKYLVIVKNRKGHFCRSTFIVICLVVWEGVEGQNADDLYTLLTDKLNKFGLPTKRRCATNEPRTCACQGANEDTCGASFSFGCSWSMYYNGCKFARSKEVRKFRLSEKNEEVEVEEKLQSLANHLSPMYRCLAPQSFKNQCLFESIASDCRLGHHSGRPFSGVTACVDFCAHAHKDLHNMINGCTVVVTLTKHRSLSKPEDEQLHVLPLYVADETDEFGSKQNQQEKVGTGGIEVLERYPCEVRTCSVPAETCLRRNRKNQDGGGKRGRKKGSAPSSASSSPSVNSTSAANSPKESYNNNEIQNGQVSSTVLDYPNTPRWRYDNFSTNSNSLYSNREPVMNSKGSFPPSPTPTLPCFSFFKTPLSPSVNPFSHLGNDYYSPNYYYSPSMFQNPATPHLNHYAAQFSNYPSYSISNPFDDAYSNNALPFADIDTYQLKNPKQKVVDISFTDNRECFQDPDIGGVAIALQHGSVLFECAKHELHATTALKKPNRLSPTRISLVFYQHRSLNKAQHGLDEYTEKMRRKLETSGQSDLDKSDAVEAPARLDCSFGSLTGDRDCWPRASTLPTASLTTMFPMYPCIVTGPFREQLSCTLGDKS